MPNQTNLDRLYIDIAHRISKMSVARRLQVGALIVKGTNIISMGWNGTPSGQDNNCEDLIDGVLVTKDSVLHAERNAVQKLRDVNEDGKLNGATLYCTVSPCTRCTDIICDSKIERVVYTTQYRDRTGIENLQSRGIKVDKL